MPLDEAAEANVSGLCEPLSAPKAWKWGGACTTSVLLTVSSPEEAKGLPPERRGGRPLPADLRGVARLRRVRLGDRTAA